MPTPRRIEPATVREWGGITLKRVFGEWFVEARHPDLRALCGPLLEEIDRRRESRRLRQARREPSRVRYDENSRRAECRRSARRFMSATDRSPATTP